MYDIKINAPLEIRGEFNPIATNVPGIQISELLPNIARNMDKLIVIRSMVGARDAHYSYQCMTGYHNRNAAAGGWPHFRSVVSHYEGPARGGMKMWQVIGSTDRTGGEADGRPVTFQEVFATIYHNLGINLDSQRLFDFRGVPRWFVTPGYRLRSDNRDQCGPILFRKAGRSFFKQPVCFGRTKQVQPVSGPQRKFPRSGMRLVKIYQCHNICSTGNGGGPESSAGSCPAQRSQTPEHLILS